jgi:hypothetical protein
MNRTLTTNLAADVIYVSGTVNGETTTWTNVEGNTWQTSAERSSNDIYHVELTIVNSSGFSYVSEFTLYYGLQLITDRTQNDVNYALLLADKWRRGTISESEKNEWFAGLKGTYNAYDLNRVGAAMEYIEARLKSAGYKIEVTPKTDWTGSDLPTVSLMRAYLNSVEKLRGVIPVFPDTPNVPRDLQGFTFEEANNIEKILEDLDKLLTNAAKSQFYSGELYAGEV